MPRIKKLDIFIARQFGLLFMGTFFICQFVLMMQFLWRYVDDLIGKGLSMDILAQFFWYMSIMLVPQALPLAILLSSLITFGNLGESSELTAIKAAGISLMQTFRSLIVISVLICLASFYFQNNIGPRANMKIGQLLLSMKQKNPELEIPEGVFYDGIPNSNFYVQKKNLNTGKLYGLMIYRMTASYEDAAIILADSGMLRTTVDKKHLVLNLWNGEWFENMQSQDFGNSAAVPYRRETFIEKNVILDFDSGFNLTDANNLSNNAQGKSLSKIKHDMDSINHVYDSIGRMFYKDIMPMYYGRTKISRADLNRAMAKVRSKKIDIDSIFKKLPLERRQAAVNSALATIQARTSDIEFKSMVTGDGDRVLRLHQIEAINKFTVALSCLIFFFIGAPLGTIIRKGGLGVPVIISVLVFIIYYILFNSGYRMARLGDWSVWFGESLAPAVLTPIAIFVTYKASTDSVVFNIDVYRNLFRQALGLKIKRHITGKEVIITDPDYANDIKSLNKISQDIRDYSRRHNLKSAPDPIKVFFKYQPDHAISQINTELETVIEDLTNTKDSVILNELNTYPVIAIKAHTRPFEHKWLNICTAIIIPIGVFLYIRMWRFRIRLLHDLHKIVQTNDRIISRTGEISINQ